ncbi:MAG: hypothetical protein ACXWUQ_09365 [Allosphingosinicella sp.]
MTDAPLIVPMELDALVLNKGAAGSNPFRWWQFSYLALSNFRSPEPEPFDGALTEQAPGIYLHWTLPTGLRHGKQDRATGAIDYPLVPNRWLVIRYSGSPTRQATAWVVENDCPVTGDVPMPGQLGSQYLLDPAVFAQWSASPDPRRKNSGLTPSSGPLIARIGVAFPLAQWSERDPDAMFLTAMAPGNHLFTSYVAHNAGIFSFHDPLDGIASDGSLAYQVIGWYSNGDSDILADWSKAADPAAAWKDLLAELDWQVAGDGQSSASLYQGMVFGVPWNAQGDAPTPDPLADIRISPNLDVAVGNNTTDAFSALLNLQLTVKGHDTGSLTLLKAFQYDLLPILNQINGRALLDWKVRQSWFGSKPGGYGWSLVPPETGDPSVALTADESAALIKLNQDSTDLEASLQKLRDLQWRSHATWWKLGQYGKLPFPIRQQLPANVTAAALQQSLDLANSDGVAARTRDAMAEVRARIGNVPQPLWTGARNPQEAQQQGIAAFSTRPGFSGGHQLKAVPRPRYWRTNDPVVVISGVNAPPVDAGTLAVRRSADLVTGFTAGGFTAGAQSCASILPALNGAGGLPAELPQLIAECFFLDPASAPSIATAGTVDLGQVQAAIESRSGYAGTLPAPKLIPWAQPWQPLLLEWRAQYSYIPFESGSWLFDGTDYHFSPTNLPAKLETRQIGGISVLGPSAQFLFQARLKSFADKYGAGTDLGQLEQWIEQIDQWQFLGQELTGFNDLLAMHDPRAYRRPGEQEQAGTSAAPYPIASLTGYNAAARTGAAGDPFTLPEPYTGEVHNVPYLANGTSPAFHGVRQGQFHIMDLQLYDKFGRVLELIGSSQGSGLFTDAIFPLVRDPAMMPDSPVQPGIAAVAQLPPRLLQHSRLDFELIDGSKDSEVLGLAADVNPVCGWVLPNHLDASLLVYAPDGSAMGEFRMVETDTGHRVGEWQPPAHGTIATLADVAARSPHLAQLLQAPGLATEAGFAAFLSAVDETLWTIDPLGSRGDQNLSVLIGRPLALVRARLKLSLDGPAWTASDWAATFEAPTPEFLAYRFPIRLGDQATRQDGTIGYFLNDDYGTFHSVPAPENQGSAGPGFVKQIGPLGPPPTGGQNYVPISFDPGDSAMLTLLVDPRASVHAVSGILPVKQLDVPAQFVDPALARIEVGFRVGPLLTPLQKSPAQAPGSSPAPSAPAFAMAINYPAPAEQAGSWSWWELSSSGEWVGNGLIPGSPAAAPGATPATLRDGILQLVANLNDKP